MEFLADLHPKVVHFPIAILMLYGVIEIIGIILKSDFLHKTAHLLLAVGLFAAVAAVLTGNQAEEAAELISKNKFVLPEKLLEEHESYATYTLWFFVAVLVFRTYLVLQKKFVGKIKYVFIPLVLIGMFLIYETGEHGGKLVYKHGIGTDLFEEHDSINQIEELE